MATMTPQRQHPAPVTSLKRSEAPPILHERGKEIQPFGALTRYPLRLGDDARQASVQALNQIGSDTMVLRDLYKKHHWQMSGPTFYQLHLLLDKHYDEQVVLVDAIAERIQILGGISVAMPHDIAEMTRIERPQHGREEVPVQISRLLDAHEIILTDARKEAKAADDRGDSGTSDLLVSQVVRVNEMLVWFLPEHLVDTPLVQAR